MPLGHCRTCDKRIAQGIPSCPHCGEVDPAPPLPPERRAAAAADSSDTRLAWIVGVLAVIGVVALAALNPTAEATRSPRSGRQNLAAALHCEGQVRARLKAPRTAVFPPASEAVVARRGNADEYRVKSYVDSENSFGALIRTRYTCDVDYVGVDRWDLIALETTP